MPKIDYKRSILPYIEMYGGNSDVWEIPIYRSDHERMSYSDAQLCTFTLVIKDYGYTHRTNGSSNFTLTKAGVVTSENGDALVTFSFVPSDTKSAYGKYVYQIVSEGVSSSERIAEQGELFITKAIDQ